VARAALAHTEQPVLDYLLGEAFATMPAAARHVLQCTADEAVVTAEAAVLLSGDPQAPKHLAALAAEGMLVTAYGSGSVEAWSYHPLLRELVRRQLAGPDRALGVAAHARAAHHHALHGPLVDAVRHAMLAGEHDLLTDLLVERGMTLATTGYEDLVAEALRTLPDGTEEDRPALLGVTALFLRSTGDQEQAVRVATLAARAARQTRIDVLGRGRRGRTPTVAETALLADVAILNAWLARLGWHDLGDAMAGAREIVDRVAAAEEPGTSDDLDPARLAWLLLELSLVETWAGDLEPATQHSDEALVIAHAVGNHRLAAASLAGRAVLQLLEGQFQTAATTARECLAEVKAAGRLDDVYLGRAHVALGWAAFYDLRLDEAAAELAEAQRLDGRTFDPLVTSLCHVLAARLVAETGDVPGARRLLSAVPAHPEPAPAFLTGIYAVVRAYWALVDGDVAETTTQLPVMRRLGWEVSTAAFDAVLADLGGRRDEAATRLDEALTGPASGEQLVCAAFAAAYRARMELAAGRIRAAEESLRNALARAAPQRLLHPLLAGASPGGAYDDLLRGLARGPDAHPFAAYVVAGLERYRRPYPDLATQAVDAAASTEKGRPAPTPRRSAGDPSGVTLPPQALTGREAEVLRELALGGSYQDVARVLYVTENTVKTHVSAVYRKLGVDRRADALRRAREIGLI
jgi:ATP/maltotriose-dependent transcriptional regulator MalT